MITQEAITALTKVTEAGMQAKMASQNLRRTVEHARSAGASWSSIAGMLGISKQSAAQRFTPRRGERVDASSVLF